MHEVVLKLPARVEEYECAIDAALTLNPFSYARLTGLQALRLRELHDAIRAAAK